MLSDKERRELREMAASAELRADFERLRLAAVEAGRVMSLDDFVAFLTARARLAPADAPRPLWREARMLM